MSQKTATCQAVGSVFARSLSPHRRTPPSPPHGFLSKVPSLDLYTWDESRHQNASTDYNICLTAACLLLCDYRLIIHDYLLPILEPYKSIVSPQQLTTILPPHYILPLFKSLTNLYRYNGSMSDVASHLDSNAAPSGKPEVTFEFNLPHGIDADEDAQGANNFSSHAPVPQQNHDDRSPMSEVSATATEGTRFQRADQNEAHKLDYRAFSPGFSDDEGSGEAFERSWPRYQANKQAAKAAKGKKSPRRSDGEDSETKARAKKPRRSLFGGVEQKMEIQEQVDNPLALTKPGLGLDNRMSSLTLDEQHDGDEVEQPTENGFGLACSDIGSVRDSPPPSDDEFIIPPDTVVSSFELTSS